MQPLAVVIGVALVVIVIMVVEVVVVGYKQK